MGQVYIKPLLASRLLMSHGPQLPIWLLPRVGEEGEEIWEAWLTGALGKSVCHTVWMQKVWEGTGSSKVASGGVFYGW